MAALNGLLLAAMLAAGPTGDGVARWQREIDAAAARCGIPSDWIRRVMQAESGGRTMLGGRPIRSVKGAIGLMQLMPGTWAELRAQLALGADPDDPADNIVAGACYLRRMHDRFGYPGLFGAYNAGPVRYAAWRAGRRALPGETVRYLAMVSGVRPAAQPSLAVSPAPLFAVRADAPDAAAPAAHPLFAIRVDR